MKKTTMTILAAVLLLMAGCSAQKKTMDDSLANTGVLMLSVNPEIRIEYDKEGFVTEVTAMNSEAEELVVDKAVYEGIQCTEVVEMLIEKIHDAGYFVDDVDGEYRNIILQIEPGSVMPNQNFMEEVSVSARNKVQKLNAENDVIEIDQDDYDEKYNQETQTSKYITFNKAQEIALAYFDVKLENVQFIEKDYDLDDGTAVYEIEFVYEGKEYDIEVDAENGKVLHTHVEIDDDQMKSESGVASNSKELSMDEAKEIALQYFGLGKDVYFEKSEKDKEDGRFVFEFEMKSGKKEYEIEIDAESGTVLNAEVDED